jgi:SPP1 gp7 family putative phage head morphogenesis protein
MRQNIYYFAGAKTYDQLAEMNSTLMREGKIISFQEFRDKIDEIRKMNLGINEKYNRTWLLTEYNHAITSSQAAARWQEYTANADLFPNLKYVTAGDERVRASHAALDGRIEPINSPFWDKYYPPNDWGCRCYVEPTVDKVTKTKLPDVPVAEMFANNVGKTGELFYNHPYFLRNEKAMKAIKKSVDKLVK